MKFEFNWPIIGPVVSEEMMFENVERRTPESLV